MASLRPRPLHALGLLFISVAILLANASGAWATDYYGAQTHSLWSGVSSADYTHELDVLHNAGANAVRIDLGWSTLESNGKGQYASWYVQNVDAFMQAASARGLKVIATLMTTPCWASSAPDSAKQSCSGQWWNRNVQNYPPSNPADYGAAAAWVAQRWAPYLAALEVWNEPDQSNFWVTSDPAGDYARLLKAAYPAIKQAAPGVTVLGGVTANSDGDFIQQLYADGIHGSFDGLSIHPYNSQYDPTIANPQGRSWNFISGTEWIHDIMSSHGDGDRGIWLTEFGFSTCTDGDSVCVSPAQQSQYTEESFAVARRWSYVKAAIVYDLRNDAEAPDRLDSYGLLHGDFTPKAGFEGFKQAMAEEGGAPSPAPQTPAPASSTVVTAVPVPPAPTQTTISVSSTGVATVRLVCRAKHPTRAHCKGVVRLRRRVRRASSASLRSRAAIGRQSFDIPPGGSATVRVRLRGTAHARLAGRHSLAVVVSAATLQPGGSSLTAARVFKLAL